ncbi:MAG: hypothetical protein ACTS4U_01485 [Candidatus Hodgkinia cicadicola]
MGNVLNGEFKCLREGETSKERMNCMSFRFNCGLWSILNAMLRWNGLHLQKNFRLAKVTNRSKLQSLLRYINDKFREVKAECKGTYWALSGVNWCLLRGTFVM